MLSTGKNKSTEWFFDLVFLTILLGIFYALWIGGHALFTPDEGRYSEIAREMVVTGDYITPRLNGVAFLDKPIFYYWLQAFAIQWFGLKEWALRFWPALVGILGCMMTYLTGHALFSRRTGILAAVILATSPLYYGAAHYANLDLEVAVLISITLLFSLLALHNESKRTLYFILAYIFCGFAALTKGLIGIIFPVLIIGLWIILLNRWNIIKKMRLGVGLALFFAITLPWYYLVQKANPQFLHFFFVTQQVSRFLTHGDFNNQTTFWFYIPVVLAGFFPWSIFAVQALTKTAKTLWTARKKHTVELFVLLWFVLIFIFFSIPKSKTVGYIIPVFPALALMVAHYLDQNLNTVTSGFKAGIAAFIVLCFFILIAAIAAPYVPSLHIPTAAISYLTFAGMVFLIAGVAAYRLFKQQAFNKIIYCLAALACTSLLILSASTSVVNDKSIKPIALYLKPKLTRNDEVVTYFKYYQDLPIYIERRITIVADWTAPDIIKKDNWLRELWFGMPFQNTKDWLIDDEAFWKKWNSQKRLFVVMNKNSYQAFLEKAQQTIRQSGQYNDMVWVSNRE
ncbi:MAG TPA: glycosyltransferase family 39 protein [Gammaproteobacteria bacterium]|nr:glycosyltransferase family 39 protein [Gammaproteobacteria bacterium]